MAKIKHPQGNTFRLGIPLAKRIAEYHNGVHSQSDENLSPLKEGIPVRVIFGKCRAFNAKLTGGYVVVEDKGTLPIGNYHATVLANDVSGDPLRYTDDLELCIVSSAEEPDYEELTEYDGYFKYPIPKDDAEDVCTITVTEDAVQIHEGTGFEGEVTEDAVKMYARFGTSGMEVTEDAVKITIN